VRGDIPGEVFIQLACTYDLLLLSQKVGEQRGGERGKRTFYTENDLIYGIHEKGTEEWETVAQNEATQVR
jgi:hypothetical protein